MPQSAMLSFATETVMAAKKKKSKKAKKHKDGMLAAKPSKGLERDNTGKSIPMKKRLPEDRAKAKKAAGK
jgi:hypothetical protein